MKCHIVVLEAVVNLTLALGLAVLVAACTAQAPSLGLECEVGAQEKYGLWCSKPPLPLSESIPSPETSQSPQARLARRNSNPQ